MTTMYKSVEKHDKINGRVPPPFPTPPKGKKAEKETHDADQKYSSSDLRKKTGGDSLFLQSGIHLTTPFLPFKRLIWKINTQEILHLNIWDHPHLCSGKQGKHKPFFMKTFKNRSKLYSCDNQEYCLIHIWSGHNRILSSNIISLLNKPDTIKHKGDERLP